MFAYYHRTRAETVPCRRVGYLYVSLPADVVDLPYGIESESRLQATTYTKKVFKNESDPGMPMCNDSPMRGAASPGPAGPAISV